MGKTSGPEESTSEKNDIWKDPRFAHLVNDPRFKQLPKHERKVKIDKRFESMFNDSKFKVKYTVDKYGRRLNQSSSEDLKKYYDIESSDEEDEDAEIREEEKQITKVDSDENEIGNDDLSNDGEILPLDIKKKLSDSTLDYARGEGRLLTDSSSDDESSSEEDDEVYIEHVWGELGNDAPRTDESTNRIAACNMDWDRIRASDIMVLCNSFLPPGGSILSVKIYPSEFGKQRMEEEELHGPPELIDRNRKENISNSDDSDDDNLVNEQDSDAEEGDEYHMEKLRQYQLNRLKYFYAVIECDSVATADKLYQECDGLEYESTATKLDLRFIPDDVTFDEDEPKDVCTELPDLSKYKPRLFTTTALQQAKVELTWDEMSIERKELNEKLASGKINEISAADLKKYVAYSSEEESDGDENNENSQKKDDKESSEDSESEGDNDDGKNKKSKKKDAISKYKSLLEEINKKEEEQRKNKYEIECSWTITTDDKAIEKEKDDKDKKNMTPIEKILEKRHEKNKKRKEERKKKLKGSDEDEDEYSSDDIPFDIDMNDPYFAEEFANGDFEPPKKSKSTEKSKKKSQKNKGIDSLESDNEDKTKELELLLEDEDDGKQHFSLKKIQDTENESKSKRKRKKKLKKSKREIEAAKKAEFEDNFKLNVDDQRFKSLYTSHLFNIDPSDPHFKKTKGMEQIIQEKLKRKYEGGTEKTVTTRTDAIENGESDSKRPKKKIENSILVKSIKRKIKGEHL